MKPSDLSKTLRQIAAKIDASKRPDRILVSRDLKRVLAAIGSKSKYDGAYSIWCFGKEADLPEGGYDLSSVERTFDVELSDLPDGSHEVTATLKSGPEIPPESNAVFSGVFPADWDLTENPDDNLRFLTYIYQNTDLPGHELVAEHIDWELADKNFSRGN